MTESAHLVRLDLDARALYRFANTSGLPLRDLDQGYAVHAALAATFDHGVSSSDKRAPKPFHLIESSPFGLQILGYSQADHEELKARARKGDRQVAGVVELSSMASRPVPPFEARRRLAFEVRACPVRRVAKRGEQRKARAEVDVYLARVWQEEDGDAHLERTVVYREWVCEELEKECASRVLSVDVTGFRLGRQFRRTQSAQRRVGATRHPDVHFAGELEVIDSNAFARRIARGVGRHRAFGFGMLLLRPQRSGI